MYFATMARVRSQTLSYWICGGQTVLVQPVLPVLLIAIVVILPLFFHEYL